MTTMKGKPLLEHAKDLHIKHYLKITQQTAEGRHERTHGALQNGHGGQGRVRPPFCGRNWKRVMFEARTTSRIESGCWSRASSQEHILFISLNPLLPPLYNEGLRAADRFCTMQAMGVLFETKFLCAVQAGLEAPASCLSLQELGSQGAPPPGAHVGFRHVVLKQDMITGTLSIFMLHLAWLRPRIGLLKHGQSIFKYR